MTTHTRIFEAVLGSFITCVKIVDKMIIACGLQSLQILDLANGTELHNFEFADQCRNFDLNRDKTLLAAGGISGLTIWDFSNRRKLKDIRTPSGVRDLRFNESGTKLVVGEYSGQISKIELY